MYTIYGIKNCDTVKKALTWLTQNKIEFDFHDYKSKGISDEKLQSWIQQIGWEVLVNKKGMTWRQLDEKTQKGVHDGATAIKLMKDKTSVIKRPLIEQEGVIVTVGFDEKEYVKRIKMSRSRDPR